VGLPLALTALAVGVGTAAAIAPDRSPKGKGVFVRSVRHCGTPEECADWAKSLGLEWVAILLAWQYDHKRSTVYLNSDLPAYTREFRKRGIKVWLWAWPVPGKSWELIELYTRARRAGIRSEGFILDPEGPYYGRRFRDDAIRDLRNWQLLNVPIGITTYGGGPANHPSFNWDVWVNSDFGIPQIYDSHHRLGPNYPAFAIKEWRDAGWKRIVPAWGASDAHTPDQMRSIIDRTPAVYKGCCWWDLYWLIRSKRRSAVVREMKIERPMRLKEVA